MNMQMLNNPVEEEDDEFEKSIESAGAVEKRREQQKGALWSFMMPKDTDRKGGTTRTTTIRFLVPFNKGAQIVQHEKYAESGAKDGFRYACPAEFGFDCEICNKVCRKHKITREEFVKNAESIDQYGNKKEWDGVTTKIIYLWPVWDYKMCDGEPVLRDGKPETPNVKLFGFAFNKNSPVGPLHNLNKTRYTIPISKGKNGTPITGYDIKITQTGVQTEKVFTVLDTDYGDFEYADKVKDYDFSKMALKIAYAMNNTKSEAELERLQKLKQGLSSASKAATSQAQPKKRASKPPEENEDKYALVEE